MNNGKNLCHPKKQERLIFDNSCNCLFDKGVLEKAMLWWSEERILKKNRKIYMHGNYPAVSIFNEKLTCASTYILLRKP